MNRTLLLFVTLLLMSAPAYADKVPSPPEDCPAGSTGDTGHEGPHCVPLDCKADADCKGGLVCKELSLCMEEKMLSPGRSPVESKYVFVYGTCEDPSTCKSPSTCKPGKRCVAATKAPTPTPTPTTATTSNPTNPTPTPTKTPEAPKAKSCAVSSPEGDNTSWLLFVLFFGWMFHRRARSSKL